MRLFHQAVGLTLLGLLVHATAAGAFQLVTPEEKSAPQQQPPATAEPPVVIPGGVAPPTQVVPLPPPAPPVEGAPLLETAPPPTLPLTGEEPPVPVVVIRVRVLACTLAGQEIEYCICVANTSPAPAHHVLVRDPLPANARLVRASPAPTIHGTELQWYLGTLPGLCSREIVLVLQPTNTDDVKNCARVQFEHGQCVCTRIAGLAPSAPLAPGITPGIPPGTTPGTTPGAPSEKDKEKVQPAPPPPPPPPPPQAKLQLGITGLKEQLVGQPVTYTITLANTGNAAARNVGVSAILPAQTAFVNASNEGQQLGARVAWNLGTLEAGASRTVDVTLKAQAVGERCVKAEAEADGNLSAQAEACTVFKGAVGIGLRVETTRNPVAVGGETSYTIVVENQGSLPATNLRVAAVIPNEMDLVKARGQVDNRLGQKLKEGQAVEFNPLPSLAAGAKTTFEISVKALRAGEARFRMELTADQLPAGPVIEQQNTTIYPGDDTAGP